ncbi:MAG TPA: aryl-sulfate sulfotransferase, partial [Polyangiaceae bacterium]|nr:aryl-sulfate sulfotransferase [Polyangiaceae bacterium]
MKRSVLGLAGLLVAACAVDPAVLGEGPPLEGAGGGGAQPPDETAGTASADAGGTTSSGGSGSGSAGAGKGGTGSVEPCEFEVSTALSPKIPTVGIVAWSTTLENVTSARIEFGLTDSYGMTAPATALSSGNRTLLLGMKQSRTYHYRISASSAVGSCQSSDFTLETGVLSGDLQKVAVTTHDAAALAGGFLVTGQYAPASSAGGAPALIIDADGDVVWEYFAFNEGVTAARQSYDGRSMWINAANVPEFAANVHRVSMDGLADDDLSGPLAGQSYQLSVLPDETVAFYAYSNDGRYDIKEYDPSTGDVRTIVNTGDFAPAGSHLDAIEYSPVDDTLLLSNLDQSSITKITRTGEVVWILGGTHSTFSWPGTTWQRQNGVQPLSRDRILFFANGAPGGTASAAIEVALDFDERTATPLWTYTDPGLTNLVMGDV